MITARSMRPLKETGPGRKMNLTTKMRTVHKCTDVIVKTLGAIMISGALSPKPKQDSYVN